MTKPGFGVLGFILIYTGCLVAVCFLSRGTKTRNSGREAETRSQKTSITELVPIKQGRRVAGTVLSDIDWFYRWRIRIGNNRHGLWDWNAYDRRGVSGSLWGSSLGRCKGTRRILSSSVLAESRWEFSRTSRTTNSVFRELFSDRILS